MNKMLFIIAAIGVVGASVMITQLDSEPRPVIQWELVEVDECERAESFAYAATGGTLAYNVDTGEVIALAENEVTGQGKIISGERAFLAVVAVTNGMFEFSTNLTEWTPSNVKLHGTNTVWLYDRADEPMKFYRIAKY